MDFGFSDKVEGLRTQVWEFMDGEVLPAEPVYHAQIAASRDPHHHPQVMEDLKAKAKAAGLWNLFMTDPQWGPGLSNLEYAPLAELMGWSPIGPEAFNCSAPDTGNMEVLARYGTPEQQERWLGPLLEGDIRSCFSMTEPDVASSDATNIRATIVRDGDAYVVSGRKWWSSGAARERCRLAIVMGRTDPEADRHRQQSMVLVPFDAPGVRVVRNMRVLGYDDPEGHPEVHYTDVRVPLGNILVGEGEGFAIAQGRLGPGRIHHCMRILGAAERALALMTRRAAERETFGRALVERQTIQDWIARSRIEIEQARMLVLKAAWMMDTVGNKEARQEIAMIKVAAPTVAIGVIDRAMQTFGAAGLSQDTPLARLFAHARTLRIIDGPDEVHLMAVARQEIRRQLAAGDSQQPRQTR